MKTALIAAAILAGLFIIGYGGTNVVIKCYLAYKAGIEDQETDR